MGDDRTHNPLVRRSRFLASRALRYSVCSDLCFLDGLNHRCATLLSMRDEDEARDLEPEHTRFYRLDHSWSFDGEDHVISVAAYDLHLGGISRSVHDDQPGFVPDDYLGSLGPGTAVAVMDLVTSGYWERVDGGYRIRDWDLLRVAMEHVQMLREEAAREHWARLRAEQEQVLRKYRRAETSRRPDEPPGSPEAAPAD